MLVARRLAFLSALTAPILVPAFVGGSDAPREERARTREVTSRDVPLAQPAFTADDLASPGHGPHTSFQPATAPRELLLSFDDGPDLAGTPLILEELDRRGLKAIFFVTGWRLMGRRPEDIARRDLVRKIAAHGHLVANHTMSHHDLCRNPNEQAPEIDGNTELIAETTGVRPLLFRSPYGAFCKSLEAALAARGLRDIGWNIDPQDWKNSNDEEAVLAYLTQTITQLHGRGILLMHDTHSASVHALPRFLDWLARENARAAREHRPPVEVIDYRAVLPRRSAPPTGLPALVGSLVADAAGAVGSHWPH
jgi:peptidoglycan/xylan/chitin deacetylase (PgdA/CDA1 family)